MFKLIKRLFLLAIVAIVAFIALALTSGGEKFRWFGNTVSDVSDDLGETADLLNQATEDLKSATHTIRKTGKKFKDAASETTEKAAAIVNATEKIVSDIKNSAGELGKADDTDQGPE